jgi:uncharacterized membrane protein
MIRIMTRRSLSQIFAMPLLIALISAAGLISALIGDDSWDMFSWLALGLPVVLYLAFVVQGRFQRRPERVAFEKKVVK